MPELIDKQKAQTEIALISKHLAKSDAQKAILGRIIFMLDHMPTIEPEVRHGRWIKQENGLNLCSVCGVTKVSHLPFCGHCGAKMDGGEKND